MTALKKLILIFGLFIFQASSAVDKTVIVAEKRTYVGIEQVGLVQKDGNLELTSNSNFLSSEFPYHYGKFEVNGDESLRKDIESLGKTKKSAEKMMSPHDISISINGNVIVEGDKKFSSILEVFDRAFKSKNLKLKDGIIITNAEDLKKISCEERKEKICTFKYGYIHE